ncbi:hypothetical protein DFS33DRAFT_521941 [Desarmillaria ectypa]|nr:hypothetical protein DFS33DRAFT_521941 [Desarmillaria ectypa]
MPRSRSVKNVSIPSSSYFTDAAMSLTPRTPQYRSGRNEEGYGQVELQEMHGDEDDAQSLTAPLLSAGSPDMDPKGGRVRTTAAVSKLPIVFLSVIAGFLFFLTVVAYWRPGMLEWYSGVPVLSFEQVPVSAGNPQFSPIISTKTTPVFLLVLMITSLN